MPGVLLHMCTDSGAAPSLMIAFKAWMNFSAWLQAHFIPHPISPSRVLRSYSGGPTAGNLLWKVSLTKKVKKHMHKLAWRFLLKHWPKHLQVYLRPRAWFSSSLDTMQSLALVAFRSLASETRQRAHKCKFYKHSLRFMETGCYAKPCIPVVSICSNRCFKRWLCSRLQDLHATQALHRRTNGLSSKHLRIVHHPAVLPQAV